MLRIAFAGTPEFALPTLAALSSSSHRLIGVLTRPDRPAGRGRERKPSPVKQLAERLGVPVAQPAELKTAGGREPLAQWQPDLLVVVAYGVILPPSVLALPRLGCINVHASLLPRWRGAAPIARAILAGDAVTGVSIMRLEAGLDTGPVYVAESVPIGATTTSAELHDRLAQLGARLLLETVAGLEAGRARAEPQTAHGVTYAPKLERHEARIDWGCSAAAIDRQVRAFDPWPVAETLWHGTQLRVWQAAPQPAPIGPPLEPAAGLSNAASGAAGAVPGTVLGLHDEQLLVACGEGVLGVRRVQLSGRKIIGAREFANAAHPIGSVLGS